MLASLLVHVHAQHSLKFKGKMNVRIFMMHELNCAYKEPSSRWLMSRARALVGLSSTS